jgi:hypothetical protein
MVYLADFLDEPSNITSVSNSPDSVNLTWSTDGNAWQPDHYSVRVCHIKSLSSAALPVMGDKCQEVKVEEGQTKVNVDNLQPFSEYEVTVVGGLPSFDVDVDASRTIRTLPKNDIEWLITPEGVLKVSWQKKIANYQEKDKVTLELSDNQMNETVKFEGTAAEVKVDQLKLGNSYSLSIIDDSTSQSFGPLNILACKFKKN